MNKRPFVAPSIDDADIAWACRALSLQNLDESRKTVVRSLEPLDVEACPGSGKTTLLVAKLAILGNKWTDRRRGVCVLSHTNVARREIETRLGNTAAGQRLLSYPHFVGTIHGFINEFLALPWLRSGGFTVKVIDNELCRTKRMKLLSYKTKCHIEKKYNRIPFNYSVKDIEFNVCKKDSSDVFTKQVHNNALREACRRAAEAGFFCHDDMFLWARNLMCSVPNVLHYIRERFPLLFMDEVQDNSEEQSSILYNIFCKSNSSLIRQRYGDINQAIYDYEEQPVATTDPFPDPSIRCDLPKSYRFGQQIAHFADPLGLTPHGLQGQGPRTEKIKTDTEGKHAVFLFADQLSHQVIPAYANYLLEIFSADDIGQGEFTAVGAVHKPPPDERHCPRTVCNYWTEYDYELSRAEVHRKNFVQYVESGQGKSFSAGESQYAVERIAEAFLHLAGMVEANFKAGNRRYRHRQMVQLLRDNVSALTQYINCVRLWAVNREKLNRSDWVNNLREQAQAIVRGLCGEACNFEDVKDFLAWPDAGDGGVCDINDRQKDNVYRHKQCKGEVCIRLGSIHSVKGETHTATMVLETFNKAHHLEKLKKWIMGLQSGGDGTNDSRLKQHYVAMTRPTHLLCIAMKENSLCDKDIRDLQQRGFRVGHVKDGGSVRWLSSYTGKPAAEEECRQGQQKEEVGQRISRSKRKL